MMALGSGVRGCGYPRSLLILRTSTWNLAASRNTSFQNFLLFAALGPCGSSGLVTDLSFPAGIGARATSPGSAGYRKVKSETTPTGHRPPPGHPPKPRPPWRRSRLSLQVRDVQPGWWLPCPLSPNALCCCPLPRPASPTLPRGRLTFLRRCFPGGGEFYLLFLSTYVLTVCDSPAPEVVCARHMVTHVTLPNCTHSRSRGAPGGGWLSCVSVAVGGSCPPPPWTCLP